ncbi:hypothetical protein F5Y15DRAFT_394259 [Xylariaceae sp. FL0016]|nr:hypothetical protein F5Y15DRAFT_394259 [Xylariaceae sp. FL0016]
MAPTGGRNQPTDQASNSNVAASNSTLNAWCGRRQPSWLANAKPVQPSRRLLHPRGQSLQLPAQPAQSSQQPSPQPRQIPFPPPSRLPQQTSSPNSLASADASADTSLFADASASPLLVTSTHDIHSQPDSAPTRFSAFASVDAVLPSPAPSDEPSPCVSNAHESPDAANTGSAEPRNMVPMTLAYFVLDDISANSESQQQQQPLPSRVPPAALPTRTASRPSSSVSVVAPGNCPANMVLNTPSTSNMPILSREMSSYSAPKRQRVGNPSLEFLSTLKASDTLKTGFQESGGVVRLEETIERPRYHLLLNACEEGDVFFVALHQLFCSWAVSQNEVHSLCEENACDTSIVDSAFGTMGTILRNNSKVRQPLLRWFTNFPAPLASLRQHPLYRETILQVLAFLVRVAHRWMLSNSEHQRHGYPILMAELLETFLLYSPVLQTIVFRASRRTLGVIDRPYGVQMEELFKADQQKHRNPDGTFSAKGSPAEYEAYNLKLIGLYRSMIAQNQAMMRRARSTNARSSVSSRTSNSASSGSGQQQYQPQSPQPNSSGTMPPTIHGNNASSGTQAFHSHSPSTSPMNLQSPTMAPNMFVSQTPLATTTQFAAPQQYAFPSSSAIHTQAFTSPQLSPNLTHNVQFGVIANQGQHYQQAGHSFPQRQEWPQQQQFPAGLQSNQSTAAPGAFSYPSQTIAHMGQAGAPSPELQDLHTQIPVNQPHTRSTSVSGSFIHNQMSQSIHSTDTSTAASVQPSGHNFSRAQSANTRTRSSASTPHLQEFTPSDRLIPPPGMRISIQDYPYSPYDKRSIENSLHQVSLRSPKRMHRLRGDPVSSERHYQAIKGFALDPTHIPPQPYLYKFQFDVSEAEFSKVSSDEKVRGEALPVNLFLDGTLRLRIRCCKVPKSAGASAFESLWAVLDTAWPEHIFMELNGKSLGVRRKAHHSKDLPIEVSSYIRPGANQLTVSVVGSAMQQQREQPYIAVEIIEVLSHNTIKKMVHTGGTLSPQETREVIKSRLAGSAVNSSDDVDVAVAIEGVSIDLADPFALEIFQIPARGKACTHLECFDLETWLNTRPGKKFCSCGLGSDCNTCPKEPSFVDKWKCPHCGKDARPYSLRIDGFLVEVRAQLVENNDLRAKSIIVSADGSWKTKEIAGGDDSDLDSDDDCFSAAKSTVKSTPRLSSIPSNREVIELD